MKISLFPSSDTVFTLHYTLNSRSFYSSYKVEKRVDYGIHFLAWLLQELRPVFSQLPVEKIYLNVPKQFSDSHQNLVSDLALTLNRTNQIIREYSDHKNVALSNKFSSVLMFRVDDERYNNLFNYISDSLSNDIHIWHEPTGFDGVSRTFQSIPLTHSIQEMVDFILAKNISSIVCINLDPLVKYMFNERINVFALLSFLGVQIIHLQNDPSELSDTAYLTRAMSDYGSIEYINMSILSKDYDCKSDSLSCPAPLMQNYASPSESATTALDTTYSLVVASNSRFDDASPQEKMVRPLLDWMENPFVDLPLWSLSISHLLDVDNIMTSHEKTLKRSHFHWLFYLAAHFMKYDIIANVDSKYDLKVYGDIGWRNVCPDNYCGYLDLDELSDMYQSPNHLFLLLNFGFTYLDHSGPVYDVIRAGSNWINVPSIVVTPELEGLRHLEYSSYSEMNKLISDYHRISSHADLAKKELRSIYHSSTHHLLNTISDGKDSMHLSSQFSDSHAAHSYLLDQKVDEYIDAHANILFQQIYQGV